MDLFLGPDVPLEIAISPEMVNPHSLGENRVFR